MTGENSGRPSTTSERLIGRAGYYIRIAVSTGSDNEVLRRQQFLPPVAWMAARTFSEVRWGGDTHDIWIDPTNPDRFVITDDGGLNITTVHGRGFHRVTLPIGQMYHVAVDNQIPYYFYSNMQDDGNMRGPSVPVGSQRNRLGPRDGRLRIRLHRSRLQSIPTSCGPPATATKSRAGMRGTRRRTPSVRGCIPLDSPPNDLKYRCHWTAPLAIDPFDHNTVYYGCQVIFKTTNGGQSWSVISPDLSTQDPARIVPSGGIVGDNLGQFYGEVVFAIAPSKIQKGLIWAGTNDGQVWYTKDDGGNWTNVTKNISGTCRRGARSPASRPRALMPAPRTSASISIWWIIAIRSSTRPPIWARPGSRSAAICPNTLCRMCAPIAEDPNCAGPAVCRYRQWSLLLARRRRATGPRWRRDCRMRR